MRSFRFFSSPKRNEPVRLVDPHPVADHGRSSIETGDAGRDGFTVLARADAQAQGSPPSVPGTIGPSYQGPDQSFEQ